ACPSPRRFAGTSRRGWGGTSPCTVRAANRRTGSSSCFDRRGLRRARHPRARYAGGDLAHEHDAGATSAHNRPLPPRVASTRTQAPVGSLLCSLVGSFVPACGSDQTGSIIFADQMVPGGGNEVSEML